MSVVQPDSDPSGESSAQGLYQSGRVRRSVSSTSLERLGVQVQLRVVADDTGKDLRDSGSVIAPLRGPSAKLALLAAVRDVLPMVSWLDEDFSDPSRLLQVQRQCNSPQGT